MTPEEHLKLMIGNQAMYIAQLLAEIDTLKAKLKDNG